MSSHVSVTRFSTVAEFELVVGESRYSVVQVAPEFVILEKPAEIPPGPDTLIIRVEGEELRREIDLVDGANASSTQLRIRRK